MIGKPVVNSLDCSDDMINRALAIGEAVDERIASPIESVRQIKRLANRPAADGEERRDWNPFDLLENPKALEDMVLWISGIARVGGLMQ